jgi:RNA polymerase sigma-70 factor (ECF subfamily)
MAEPSFPEPPDEERTLELVGRIQVGDEGAFDDLYRRYHDDLLFSVRARLGARLRGYLESEDILQSVAIEAFRALPRFEPRHPGSLRHFLHRLVVNKIRDRADTFAARKRSGAVPLTESMVDRIGADPLPRYHDRARFERLERALLGLPEEMRQVVLLRKVDGLPSQEAAEVLGRSDAAVRKLYSRAMARLTLRLTELDRSEDG